MAQSNQPDTFQANEVHKEGAEEEEYVLLEFDCDLSFPPNTPYTLSGLDTMNPVLTIGDGTKLVGEYVETVGTCLVFSEGEGTADPGVPPRQDIKSVGQLQKVLKFKLISE
eukprot:TRINITY_DN2158_c0_g1_i2.p1 TRINITY_DN2158_c0_g1~~TRINITY_DN2158_c0_g1_i2.p1  ORF type:complete len:111 (+),score=28.22 TRINITY_DN2158_c0_g1_i2:90-422(+)